MQLGYDAGQPLDLNISLLMGQAFRWQPEGAGWFSGVVSGQFIQIRKVHDGLLEFQAAPGPDATAAAILRNYLRLDDEVSITTIYADISRRNPKVAELVEKYPGLRILRQEPWECLISYILSAQSPIPRIERNVKALADQFGNRIAPGVSAFPTPRQLDEPSRDEISQVLVGFKRYAESISLAAREVACHRLDLDGLAQMKYETARKRLKQCYGIGDKIADCVLLFSLDKLESFPIDRHIRKALSDYYFPGGKTPTDAKLRNWAQNYFGRYAGYAGQFLFYAERPQEK